MDDPDFKPPADRPPDKPPKDREIERMFAVLAEHAGSLTAHERQAISRWRSYPALSGSQAAHLRTLCDKVFLMRRAK